MSIHWHNSYAPRSRRRTGRREVQSREPVNKGKEPLCIFSYTSICLCMHARVNIIFIVDGLRFFITYCCSQKHITELKTF
jgi:hypothetical protein